MSNSSRSSGGGFGAFGLTGFIGSIVAWCNTPAFVGWAGAGKALMVGAATSIGGTLLAIPAAIGGAIIGGIAGLATGSKKVAVAGAIGGAVLCGIGGGIYGAVEGYDFGKKALTEGCKTAFNQVSDPAAASSQAKAYAAYNLSAEQQGARQVWTVQPG
ncbi:MAG: hypothetical protein EPN97_03405 [Alphaproteobacteria bacterium]|nr:MAG: hypothetical protein EPN97_03405 [Alphaproteobacteria bacterium]